MSINKSYVMAGAAIMATSIALPLANISTVDAASQITTVTENVNFRTGPSTSYSSMTIIAKGSSIEVLSTSGDWVNAKYNGKTGYIYKQYVASSSTSESTGTTQYVNTTAGLNVRSGPSTSYSKITTLSYGQSVTVISTSNGWSKINYSGGTGYVSSQYLQSTNPSSGSTSESTGTTQYVNTTAGLNVRSGPSTSYSKITTLSYGQSVTVISTSNGWSKINYSGGTGYVSSQYLQSTNPSSNTSVSASASAVIAYAQSLLGKPYVWGAQGPNSFDCSGFTYYVFKNVAGITLPRTSSLQSQYGTYVSWSNLKAGDLMFFDTNGVNNGQVSHVGLYIGNGQMIHASYSNQKIVITSINSSYYINSFVNARRVL